MHVPALVRQQPRHLGCLVGGPVPHDVPAQVARAQVVARPRDRIAQELLAGRQVEREAGEDVARQDGGEGPLVGKAAPGDVAGIERLRLGQQLRAHRRTGSRRRRPARPPSAPSHRQTAPLCLPPSARRAAGPCPDDSARHRRRRPASRTGGSRRSPSADRRVARSRRPPDPAPAAALWARRSWSWSRCRAPPRRSRISGWVMMPAPRPESGAGERSKTSDLPAAPAQVERREQPAHGAADDQGAASMLPHPCTRNP